MTVQEIAVLLLVLRLVSISLVVLVLRRQFRLFKITVNNELVRVRAVMFSLGVIFFLGHILPIATDIYYGFVYEREGEVNILVYYAISNCISALVASILLWNIYRISGKELDKKQEEKDEREK